FLAGPITMPKSIVGMARRGPSSMASSMTAGPYDEARPASASGGAARGPLGMPLVCRARLEDPRGGRPGGRRGRGRRRRLHGFLELGIGARVLVRAGARIASWRVRRWLLVLAGEGTGERGGKGEQEQGGQGP